MQSQSLTAPPHTTKANERPVVPWNSFAHTVDRIMDGITRGFEMTPLRSPAGTPAVPPIDILESTDDLRVEVEVPGLAENEIEVSIVDDVLMISGRKASSERDGYVHRHGERVYGSFQRRFTLPCPVNQDATTATLKDGILYVTVPKAEQARPRRIEIVSAE